MKSTSLSELRAICGKTQEQVAKAMRGTQATVSQIEGRSDMRLSTLRSYVRALGGELEIFARFGYVEYRLRVPRNSR